MIDGVHWRPCSRTNGFTRRWKNPPAPPRNRHKQAEQANTACPVHDPVWLWRHYVNPHYTRTGKNALNRRNDEKTSFQYGRCTCPEDQCYRSPTGGLQQWQMASVHVHPCRPCMRIDAHHAYHHLVHHAGGSDVVEAWGSHWLRCMHAHNTAPPAPR